MERSCAMGDVTIRGVEEAVLAELRLQADRRGLDHEAYAAELLRQSVAMRRHDRAAVARAILAAQPEVSTVNSVDLIREDRNR